jgi:hypothetical protein
MSADKGALLNARASYRLAPPAAYINRKTTFLVAVVIAVLLTVGLMTLVAVQTLRKPPDACKPFTIGQSAIGSCDSLEGSPAAR